MDQPVAPKINDTPWRMKGASALMRPGIQNGAEVVTWSAMDVIGAGIPMHKIRFNNAVGNGLGSLTGEQKARAIDTYDISEKN